MTKSQWPMNNDEGIRARDVGHWGWSFDHMQRSANYDALSQPYRFQRLEDELRCFKAMGRSEGSS